MKYFEGIALGLIDSPEKEISLDISLFNNDKLLINFSECHYSIRGNFDKHYWASIPYSFEQECRLGSNILQLSKKRNVKLWCINMAEATLARTLSTLSNGSVKSLANTTNIMNESSFYRYGKPEHAWLIFESEEKIIENFQQITPTIFHEKFDIIIEDTSFQMKSPNRYQQILNTKKLLKEDGIFILTEKFLCKNYEYWEDVKNTFKVKHFNNEQIKNKENMVLKKMITNQVSIDQLKEACMILFQHGVVFWNSCNFYSIAVSNNRLNLLEFISNMTKPCLPEQFIQTETPYVLFGLDDDLITYRK